MGHDLRNEATIFLVDDGDASINRDYGLPEQTRLQAQADAVNTISNFIFRNHGESAVGLMTIGGHVTNQKGPTRMLDAVLGKLRTQIDCAGPARLVDGLRTAACALMTRGNKTQKPHIIAIVCSDLVDDVEDIIHRVKILRKSSITVDIISMNRMNESVHETLNEVANRTQAKYVPIPPRTTDIADVILRAGVIDGVDLAQYGGADGFDDGFGDADDFALETALQLSLREQ